MRSLWFKVTALAFVALTGCGGGGGNSGSAIAASNQTTGSAGGIQSGGSSSSGGSSAGAATGSTSSSTSMSPGSTAADPASNPTTNATTPTTPTAVTVTATPANAIVGLNGVLTLSASATSSTSVNYQWRRNGLNLSGETASTLTRALSAADQGASFDVLVSNNAGTTASAVVQPQLIMAPGATEVIPTCHTLMTMPTTGTPVDALAGLDSSIQAYLLARQTPAATLVVRYNGVVVLERGYGWQDLSCTRPMSYSGVLRLASLTKPLTVAAIEQAVAAGKLQLGDKIFCLKGSTSACILDMSSVTAADPRIANITIQNLIDHTSGWDGALNPDAMFRDLEIEATLGLSAAPSRLDITRFIVSTTALNYDPGTTKSYLNFGYMLLGLALEARTGQAFLSDVQNVILGPLGISKADALQARSLPALRDAREPWYSDPSTSYYTDIFDPKVLVKFPDGGANFENLGSAGGLALSARTYSKFMSAYPLFGTVRGPLSWFFGSLPGTFTYAYQYGPVDLVLLTNQRQADLPGKSTADDEAIDSIVQTALGQVQNWPTRPPAGHLP